MLAIVIPYYKVKYFEKTLQSLANQTDKRFKVYIGNDNSPENPENLINSFKNKFSIDYFTFKTNLGKSSLTKQWERCILKVQDEKWIMILGDDDVLDVNVVESFYFNLSKVKELYSVIRFTTIIIDEYENNLTENFIHPVVEKSTDFLIRKINGETRSSLSEYIFEKAIYLEKKFYNFPLAWYSDDLAILEFSNFNSIYSINNASIYIRISTCSISGSIDNEAIKIMASLQFYVLILKKYKNKFTESQLKVVLKRGERYFFKKMKLPETFFFLRFHIENYGFISTLKFLRRILINLKIKK